VTVPGYEVDLIDLPPSLSGIADSGVLFAIGESATEVPLAEVFNIGQFETAIGPRTAGTPFYDAVDAFFSEGGSVAYLSASSVAITAAEVPTMLANFDASLGVAQVAAPGITDTASQLAVMSWVYTRRPRAVALLDATDSALASDLVAQATALTGQNGDRFSALFGPWDIAPGVTAGDGSTRTIPPSGRIAGNIAYNDSQGFGSNQPAAGPFGVAQWVLGVSETYNDSDLASLAGASVNVTRMVQNNPRTMGWRSLADQVGDSNWSMFSGSRCVMIILYDVGLVADNFEFNKLDSQQHTISSFNTAIGGAITPFWDNDDLYGATAAEAFTVDTSVGVDGSGAPNTPSTMAAGELHANIALRTSPFDERVIVQISKVPITQSLIPVTASTSTPLADQVS
jgi:hypothetical protein